MAREQVTATRRSLFEIEREKRWRIWLLFALLLAVICVGAWVAYLVVSVIVYLTFPLFDTVTWLFTPRAVAVIFASSLLMALAYWLGAQIGAKERLLRAMHCRPLDRGDRYHERLANIVEEIRIATGAPRIECFTVRTVGLNAFAFSDLHGGGVIGVTEGALARLSRQQLTAVVAHEFAHVLSGSYVTVTVSCLLFGVYSSLSDRLEEAAYAGAGTRGVPLVLAAVSLRGWLWVLQLASSVTSAALSRERERQADLAAARYTRDPLSLAEALRIIGRHPGGAGYIPEGLGPLCIRATGGRRGWPAGSWHGTHPPLSERVAALLTLANVPPDEFERQAEQAATTFSRREHWSPGPAARGAGRSITPVVPVVPGVPGGADATPGVPAARAPDDVPSSRGAPVASGSHAPSAARAPAGTMDCPTCGAGLVTAPYEGLEIVVCCACGGRLVQSAQVGKVLARREVAFTDDQRRLADWLTASGDHLRQAALAARGRCDVPLVPCPRCAKLMMRRHYSYEHAVEVDYCSICDLFWFEKDELEALQLLVERQAG